MDCDGRVVGQRDRDRQRVGDHGEPRVHRQQGGEPRRRGPRIEDDRPAVRELVERGPGDALLLRGHDRLALGHRQLEAEPLDRYRAAVHTVQKPAALKRCEVAAHSLLRHVE